MTVTTPTTGTTSGAGYGDLDRPQRPSGPGGRGWLLWLIVGLVLVVVVIAGFVLFGSGGTDSAAPVSTPTSSVTTPSTEGTSTSITVEEPAPGTTTPGVEIEVAGYELGGDDLPGYVTEPIYNTAGTLEGDIEVGFINGEIATIRALANPTVEEPELTYWLAGFSLRAARDTQTILTEDGQVILPGPLTRLEIENIEIRSDTEADVEYCTLFHDFSVVVADTDDRVESIVTRHQIDRVTLGPDGQWRNTELVSEIQVTDGFGSCLDVELEPVGTGSG